MSGEFTKSTKIKAAVTGTLANPDEYNQNIAGQSKGSILPIDVDGEFADGALGDETQGTNGALISNLKLRNTAQITTYDNLGALDQTINFGQATEIALGTAELATQAETDAGTDDEKIVTPLKLATNKTNNTFESAEQTITIAGSFTIAHGLSSQPKNYKAFFVCKTAQFGYSVGDEALVRDSDANSNGPGWGLAMIPDSTNIFVRYGSFRLAILNKSDGTHEFINATNAANWRVIIRASTTF